MSGDFLSNAVVDYWMVGTNIIERRLITNKGGDSLPEKNATSGPVMLLPSPGEKTTIVHPSPNGRPGPAFHTVAGVVWVAFCSGNYLKQDSRQIPMLIGPSSEGFGYSDKTVLLDDGGLPKSLELYATTGQLVCKYEVLEATNFLGRTFPLQFHVFQQGQPAQGQARFGSTSELFGRVTSIKPGKQSKPLMIFGRS